MGHVNIMLLLRGMTYLVYNCGHKLVGEINAHQQSHNECYNFLTTSFCLPLVSVSCYKMHSIIDFSGDNSAPAELLV